MSVCMLIKVISNICFNLSSLFCFYEIFIKKKVKCSTLFSHLKINWHVSTLKINTNLGPSNFIKIWKSIVFFSGFLILFYKFVTQKKEVTERNNGQLPMLFTTSQSNKKKQMIFSLLPSNLMTLNILRPTNFFFSSHPPYFLDRPSFRQLNSHQDIVHKKTFFSSSRTFDTCSPHSGIIQYLFCFVLFFNWKIFWEMWR